MTERHIAIVAIHKCEELLMDCNHYDGLITRDVGRHAQNARVSLIGLRDSLRLLLKDMGEP